MCILFIKKDFGKINWVFTMFEIIESHLYVSKAEYSYLIAYNKMRVNNFLYIYTFCSYKSIRMRIYCK